MQTDKKPNATIRVAGPTNHPQVNMDVRSAESMIRMRARIHAAARAALPPHQRRPAKGRGRWPGRMSPGSLGI